MTDYADERLYADAPVDLSRITSDIFLSNFATSLRVDVLQAHGIRSIIFLHYIPKTEATLKKYDEAGIAHHYLFCYDSAKENITKHIDKIIALLEGKTTGASVSDAAAASVCPFPVLFHCQEGISRSPALVMAWLMHSQRLSFADAKSIVKSQRKVVRVNEGFEKQLRKLEERIKDADKQLR